MTKTELKEKLAELQRADIEDNHVNGSEWQQTHALMVEQYIDTYPKYDVDIAALIFALNTDVQVRDYAMGLNNPNSDSQYLAWHNLVTIAPASWRNAQACLASSLKYEQGDATEAVTMLNNTQASYPLAQLLTRVYTAGWDSTTFATMRAELHPKVVALIFNKEEVNA